MNPADTALRPTQRRRVQRFAHCGGQLAARLGARLGVRPAEAARVARVFALSAALGFPALFVTAAAAPLFLDSYAAAELPWFYIASAIAIPLLGLVVERTRWSMAFSSFGSLFLASLALITLGLYVLTGVTEARWPRGLLLLWSGAQLLAVSTLFWQVANQVFNVGEGKRLFGLVSSGEVLVSIVGGGLTPVLVGMFGTRALLLLAAGGHLAAVFAFRSLKVGLDAATAPDAERASVLAMPEESVALGGLGDLLRHRYVLLVFAVNGCGYLLACTVENGFYALAEQVFPDADRLAAFLGPLIGGVGLATLLAKLLVSGRWLRRVGVRGALLTLPAAVFVASCLVCAAAGLGAGIPLLLGLVTLLRALAEVTTESVTEPAYYSLLQPLLPASRERALANSETIVGQVAGGGAGLLLMLAQGPLAWGARGIIGLTAAIAAAAVAVAWIAGRAYRRALGQALGAEEPSDLPLADPAPAVGLEPGLAAARAVDVAHALELLEQDPPERAAAAAYALERGGEVAGAAVARRLDQLRDSPELCARLTAVLGRIGGEAAAERLGRMLDESDPATRGAALRALVRRADPAGPCAHAARLTALLDRERALAVRCARAAVHVGRIGETPGGPLLLRALREELVAGRNRVLDALTLLHPGAAVRRAAAALRQGVAEQTELALELLDATLPRAQAACALPLLDTTSPEQQLAALGQDGTVDAMDSSGPLHDLVAGRGAWPVWVRAVALPVAAGRADPGLLAELQRCACGSEPLLAAVARAALTGPAPEVAPGPLPVVDRLRRLAEAEVFEAVGIGQLLPLAGAAGERSLAAGERVCAPDEVGDTLYLVAEGEVRVHRGDLDLARLGRGRVFGELSALVPEVPAASVTAVRATRALCVPGARLQELMARHPEAGLGMLRVLCRRIRGARGVDRAETETTVMRRGGAAHVGGGAGAGGSWGGGMGEDGVEVAGEAVPVAARPHGPEALRGLETSDFLGGVSREALARLVPRLRELRLARGTVLFRQGDPGTAAFVVLGGRLRVQPQRGAVTEVGAGAVVGELALFDPAPRSATVAAGDAAVRLLGISREALEGLVWDEPGAAWAMAGQLVRCLRRLVQERPD